MPTIAEIAEGVRLKAAHQVLEHRLAELRAIGNGFRQRYANVLASDQLGEGGKQRSANALAEEDRLNNAAIRKVRVELQDHRERHAARVAQALLERRVAAAHRIVQSIDDLLIAVDEWNEIAAAVRKWGGDDPSIADLRAVLAPVRRRASGEP